MIHRLKQAGLIAPVAAAQGARAKAGGQGNQRILYRITAAGRARFRALMLEQVPYTAYDADLFVSKLGYFDEINAEQQKEILQYHLNYLQAHEDYIRAGLGYALGELEIPEPERARIRWVTKFRLRRIQSEEAWVQTALKDASAGGR